MYSTVLATALTGFALVNAQSPSLAPSQVPKNAAGAPQPVPGVTGKLGNADIVDDNLAGVTYTAFLPNSTTSNIRGYVAGTSNANGTGVNFAIQLSGLPDPSLGPFSTIPQIPSPVLLSPKTQTLTSSSLVYHIHDQPVPSNGNCTATLAHQDPYIRGEVPPCDPVHPETCQTGDLAGKHGNITTDPFSTAFLDLYLSTHQGPASFFGNRSIVIHTSNATRLTCANFTLTTGNSSTSSNGTSAGNGTVTGSNPVPSPFTGGAAVTFASAGAIVAGLAALLL
ncbi:MAG: hypothetical protein L6R40_002456 [Gallowayella cf. fulva]|nr:MAG: hypothetical protein L6R40_002456 [Xanthomendoza cf. fulva]